MSNCGCNQTPTTSCGASLQVPVDVLIAPTNNPCPVSGSDLAFFQTTSGFVVPPSGSQSSMMVQNGSVFTAGQWIQFVNPAGSFRIMAVTGNTLTLQNAASDGVTPITGNPVPPFQYGPNAAFVTVAQPNQLTQAQFNDQIQAALAQLSSVCLNGIPERSDAEEVFMLGYVKSTLCGDNEGCCLRKMQEDDGPYLKTDGTMVFQGPVQALAFNTPVPPGGIPAQNTTILNPNNGTGGGFLLPFTNPSTGQQAYIDLFSGASNGNQFVFSLSPTGVLSATIAERTKVYYPDKEVTKGTGTYNGYPLTSVDVATMIGEAVPSWATHVKIMIAGYGRVAANKAIRVMVNNQEGYGTPLYDNEVFRWDKEITVPMTNGRFDLQILTYADVLATTSGPVGFNSTGFDAGFIRVAISGLTRING